MYKNKYIVDVYMHQSYIMAVNLLVEKIKVLGEKKHWPVECHWQTLSHNFALSTPDHHERNSRHNFSGDRYWLHR